VIPKKRFANYRSLNMISYPIFRTLEQDCFQIASYLWDSESGVRYFLLDPCWGELSLHSLSLHPKVLRIRLSNQLSKPPISISREGARRLAVKKQHLAGKLPAKPTRDHILSAVRDLTFVQWDPIAVVAPSHVLSLWNRVGDFPPADLEKLLWDEKKLFLHWVNFAASLVLIEHYPLNSSLLTRYPESIGKSWGARKPNTRKFLAENKELGRSILKQLKKGPMQLTEFKEYKPVKSPDGWSPGSPVTRMLFHLGMSGEIMVAGHQGNRNIWALAEEFLPKGVEKKEIPEEELERLTVQRTIRALGTASARDINYYFPRGRYQNLKKALESLEEESTICLLYTSPSPRDLSTSRMPSSA